MTVEEYRESVRRTVGCSHCQAGVGQLCANTYGTTNPVTRPIQTVHDDRCHTYLLHCAAHDGKVIETEPQGRPAVQGLCPDCKGTGYSGGPAGGRCPRCRGDGRVDELEHSAECVRTDGRDPECPSYFVLLHPDGDQHCQECHGLGGLDGPYCGHIAGCPGC